MTATHSAGVMAALRGTPKPVRYLLAGVLVNQLGAFVQTFMVLYLLVRGFSTTQAGFGVAAYSAGALVGGLVGGELVHRIGPRLTIVVAMLGSGAVLTTVPFVSRPEVFWLLVVILALAGLATQTYRPAVAVLLSDLMPDDLRVMGFSMMRTALNLGAALGPLIAAGLILVNWDLLLWFDAASALAYAALAYWLLPNLRVDHDKLDQPTGTRAVYGLLLRDRRFLLFLASVFLGSAVYVQYTVALPLKISAEGLPTGLYTAVLVTAAVVLILCELKITSYVRRIPGHVAAAAGTVLMGLGIAGFSLSGASAVALMTCTVVFVIGMMVNGPTMFAHPASYPAAVKGRYISAHQAVFGFGMTMGPLLGVSAWTLLGNGIWPLCGLIMAGAAFCAFLGMKPTLLATAK